ncbi:MAG: hypothetical protein Q9159_005388 [Coniocarpon cinnabarinum]
MPPRKLRPGGGLISQSNPEEAIAKQLPPKDEQLLKTIILPKRCSPDTRIVSLANPSTGKLSRYLYCAQTGFYELTRVPGRGPIFQSSLLVPQSEDQSPDQGDCSDSKTSPDIDNGHIMEDAQLLIATPMDPRLLLMPLFQPGIYNERGRPHMARLREDLLDDLATSSKHMGILVRYPSVQKLFFDKLEDVCEPVDALGQTAYRPDSLSMLGLLVSKAETTVDHAWPKSLETYVQKRLEVPAAVALIKDKHSGTSQVQSSESALVPDANGSASVTSKLDDDPESQSLFKPNETVVKQMRLRVALDFILSSYVHPKLKQYFEKIIESPNSQMVDLSEVDAFLERIEQLKAEAQALRSISDNVSRKRSAEDNDEAQEARNEKRRKKDEEEKKRKQESRATKDLKKVDTSGMKKMSSFFSKKAAT